MTDPPRTTASALVRACEIGAAAGLRFVYAGNLPGRAGTWENTYCPGCRALLVERVGFRVPAEQPRGQPLAELREDLRHQVRAAERDHARFPAQDLRQVGHGRDQVGGPQPGRDLAEERGAGAVRSGVSSGVFP